MSYLNGFKFWRHFHWDTVYIALKIVNKYKKLKKRNQWKAGGTEIVTSVYLYFVIYGTTAVLIHLAVEFPILSSSAFSRSPQSRLSRSDTACLSMH